MFGNMFNWIFGNKKSEKKKAKNRTIKKLLLDFFESDFAAKVIGYPLGIIIGFLPVLAVAFIADTCSPQGEQGQETLAEKGIIGTEQEFSDVQTYLEANEKLYIQLFPFFDRQKNIIKLCRDDGYGNDVYYLKDDSLNIYRIGYSFGWKFHLDTLQMTKQEALDLEFDDCEKLDI